MNITLFGTSVVLLLVSAELIQQLAAGALNTCLWVLVLTLVLTPVTWLGSPQHLRSVNSSPESAHLNISGQLTRHLARVTSASQVS